MSPPDMRPFLTIASLSAVCACNEQPFQPRPVPDAGRGVDGGGAALAPALPSAATEGTVSRIATPAEVPLRGYHVDAKAGDWMLRNAGSVAVVSAAKGRIVDYAPEGGDDGLYYIEALAFDALDKIPPELVSIEPAGEHALHVEKRMLGKPLELHAWIYFTGATLRLESMLTAAAGAGVLAVTQGEIVAWGNTPTWMDGKGFVTTGGTFAGEFLARESHGLAYAECSDAGRLSARFSSPDLPGFHESARTGEQTVSVPGGGASPRRTVSFAFGRSLGDAALALPCMGRRPRARAALPEMPASPPHGLAVEIAHCAPDASTGTSPPKEPPAPTPYFRIPLEASRRELDLPEGCLRARLVAPGYAPGPWALPPELATKTGLEPVAGLLRWKVVEGTEPVPAKVTVRGIAPTKDPSWGDDPDEGAAMNAVYSDTGEGERPLPPGAYRVTIHRGHEYSVDEREIHVEANRTVDVRARLDRVVDTTGWISADLHVHAVPSFDAPTLLTDRVRSLAAVGVEVAVATDHNAVTDYGPTIKEMKLGGKLASIVGDEVTTKEVFFGHFNTFPLQAGGAPVPWESISPKGLFAAARAAGAPGLPFVVQVNHPRMSDIGYFELLHLDPGDVQGWLARSPLVDMQFDALEVFNGDHYAEIKKVERCLHDWYALLNAGYRPVATGNSDSHKITYQEAGVPRNWVAVPNDDPGAFDPRAFLESLKAGRVVVSNGPFVRLEANGQGIGASVPPGPVEISIAVDAPPWIDVDRVELVRRGEVLDVWTGPFAGTGSRRFSKKITETLTADDWIVAIARGTKPMKPLYRDGAEPFGFTNPIWIK